MWYWVIYGVIMFAGLAMMVREGFWSNTIALINTIVSGLVAFGLFQPIVVYLDEMTDGRHTYWLDFTVIWALFCATMVICRTCTAAASKTRMRFKNPIDPVGGPILGLLTAWVLAAITLATLHVAPMSKNGFGDKLVNNNVASSSPLTSPDAAWLKFVERMSQPAALGSSKTDQFKAQPFVKLYADRRQKFESAPKLINKRG